MITNKYGAAIDTSMSFIRSMRLVGPWVYDVEYHYETVVGSFPYLSIGGGIIGAPSLAATYGVTGISSYEDLVVSIWTRTDVDYWALFRQEREVFWGDWFSSKGKTKTDEGSDSENWDNWAWQTDPNFEPIPGDPGMGTTTYLPVNADGTFGNKIYLNERLRQVILPFANNHIFVYRKSDLLLIGGNKHKDPNYSGTDYPEQIWTGITHGSILYQRTDPAFNAVPSEESETGIGYRLNTRAWIYVDALIALAYMGTGDYTSAMLTLQRDAAMQYLESSDGYYYGGWSFSYDAFCGKITGQDYLRNGAVAWLLNAYLIYQKQTGDTQFQYTIIEGIKYLLNEQSALSAIATDDRKGLLPVGWNWYANPDYRLNYLQQTNCSMEHNIDAIQVFRLAYALLGNIAYSNAANTIEQILYSECLFPGNLGFYQGITSTGPDAENALDCSSWAGIYLISSNRWDLEKTFYQKNQIYYQQAYNINLDIHNNWYEYTSAQPLVGFMPYAYYLPETETLYSPEIVWTEGTLGVVAFLFRTGRIKEAQLYLDQTIVPLINGLEIVNAGIGEGKFGGLVSCNIDYPDLPWEFDVNPSCTNSAWFVVLATRPDFLWTQIAKTVTVGNVSLK